jgi:hypothetical protein
MIKRALERSAHGFSESHLVSWQFRRIAPRSWRTGCSQSMWSFPFVMATTLKKSFSAFSIACTKTSNL